jgi:hypothetical protein
MKTTGIISALIMVVFTIFSAEGQAPQGINYQSVIRNTSGSAQVSTPVILRFSILQGGDTGTPVYVETQGFTTNAQGLVAATIGQGTPVQGTFSAIDWSLGSYYLKVEANINNQGSYSVSGTSLIASVPYALFAGNAGSASALASMGAKEGDVLKWNGSAWKPAVDSSNTSWGMKNGNIYTTIPGNVGIGTDVPAGKLEVKGSSSDPNVALFEVKDKNGNPIFSVYPTGVEIIYDETAPVRGAKGGFAVSGRNSTRAVVDVMRVTTDSTTIFVNDIAKRGAKGGFAVSGRNSTRATSVDILKVTPDSTRIYTSDPTKGFGVGEIGASNVDSYLKLLPDNYFIGHQSGQKTTGLYNTFIGYTAGVANTTGSSNIFIGYEVGKTNITGSFNTFLGYQAGYTNNASYNSFIGYQAGRSTTTGQYNSFIGYKAGYANTTGYSNVFMGDSVAVSNTFGNKNVMLGNLAGKNNTSGSNNVYIGYQAGYLGTYGGQNICIGNYAGYSNTTGQNLFIGEYAGEKNTSGSRNSCVGFFSGQMNVTGGQNSYFGQFAGMDNLSSYNTFIGYWSGGNNIDGTKNAYLGYRSGQASTGSNNVFLGYMTGENCTGTGNVLVGYMAGYGSSKSNALYIANSNTSTPLIGGDFTNARVGIGRMPTTYALEVAGTIWANGSTISAGATTWSDQRFKTNITPLSNSLDLIMKLKGVRFDWNRSAFPERNFTSGKQVGFVAQDVESVLPELVATDSEGYKSVSYDKVSAVLVEAVKEQQLTIEKQAKENAEQKVAIDELKIRIAQLEELVKKRSNK